MMLNRVATKGAAQLQPCYTLFWIFFKQDGWHQSTYAAMGLSCKEFFFPCGWRRFHHNGQLTMMVRSKRQQQSITEGDLVSQKHLPHY